MNEPLVLAEREEPSWGFGEVLIAIAMFLLIQIVVVLGAAKILRDAAKTGYGEVAQLLIAYLLMFGMLKVIFFLRGQPLLKSLAWTPTPFRPFTLAMTGLALVLLSLMLQVVLRTPDVETPFSRMLDSGLASRLSIALFGVTIAPVAEEMIFRGFLQPVMINGIGVFPGILTTSLLFGALHLAQNADLWQAGVTITIAGFGFGVVRHISGSTRASA
ncbi:MAG: CPBP family intramembrane metalloprotease, partial [Acidobacteriota bacterium]|nr:CPBP family intramembrane metalloprotease [Acidobacteriota bacterium]